jgi:hypothetical protein
VRAGGAEGADGGQAEGTHGGEGEAQKAQGTTPHFFLQILLQAAPHSCGSTAEVQGADDKLGQTLWKQSKQ